MCENCEQLKAMLEQQAAVIEQMREALKRALLVMTEDGVSKYYQLTTHQMKEALSLQPCPEMLNKVTKLEAENATQKDAERYRWVRDNPWNKELTAIITYHRNSVFDTAIDQAMQEQKP